MHCLDMLFILNVILIRRLKTLDWNMFINIYKQDCGGWRLCLLCLGKNNTPLAIWSKLWFFQWSGMDVRDGL